MNKYRDGVGITHTKPLPELNHALLEETISWALHSYESEQEPRISWNQNSWGQVVEQGASETECATSYCIAGYATMAEKLVSLEWYQTTLGATTISGWDHVFHYSALKEVPGLLEFLTDHRGHDVCLSLENIEDDTVACEDLWSDIAQFLLGLTNTEAAKLFIGENTIDEVLEYADAICEARGLPLVNPQNWRYQSVSALGGQMVRALDKQVAEKLESSWFVDVQETIDA